MAAFAGMGIYGHIPAGEHALQPSDMIGMTMSDQNGSQPPPQTLKGAVNLLGRAARIDQKGVFVVAPAQEIPVGPHRLTSKAFDHQARQLPFYLGKVLAGRDAPKSLFLKA